MEKLKYIEQLSSMCSKDLIHMFEYQNVCYLYESDESSFATLSNYKRAYMDKNNLRYCSFTSKDNVFFLFWEVKALEGYEGSTYWEAEQQELLDAF